jgi:KDO2-lipid IV(A) lauroyltransferase
MKAFSFYLALPFLYLLAVLPMRWLYAVSGCLYYILFYLVGYRKKVVYENFSRSFPEWGEEELNKAVKTYYSYFCDLLTETFKLLVFTPEKLLKRCEIDPGLLHLLAGQNKQNKKVLIAMAHYGNWEWASNAIRYKTGIRQLVVYKNIKNPYFEKLTNKMRAITGAELVPMGNILRVLTQNRAALFNLVLATDQAPPPETAYWTSFLNQDTPFFNGVEKLSKKFDMAVVFLSVRRKARGRYVLNGELINDAQTASENDITEKYARLLEAEIRRDPYTWLWSHRRWKHSRKTDTSSLPGSLA